MAKFSICEQQNLQRNIPEIRPTTITIRVTVQDLITGLSSILCRILKTYHHSPTHNTKFSLSWSWILPSQIFFYYQIQRQYHAKNLPCTWSFAATDTMAILPTISTQPDPRASSSLLPALSPRTPLRNQTRWSLVTAHTAFVPTETWVNFKSSGAPTSNQNSPENSSYGNDEYTLKMILPLDAGTGCGLHHKWRSMS